MKYTVCGYNQQVAVELGLDTNDLLILRWFQDFIDNGRMQEKVIDGETYYWIRYDYLLEQLPILGIKKQALTKKIKNLVDLRILSFHLIKHKGNYSYYRFNENGINYKSLIDPQYYDTEIQKGSYPNIDPIVPQYERVDTEIQKGSYPNIDPIVPQYETNINQSNINQSNINQSNMQGNANQNGINFQKNNFQGDIYNYIQTIEPNLEVQQCIYDFITHKNDYHKHRLTDTDVRYLLEKLKHLSKNDDMKKIELIRTAIFSKWKDLFPLNDFKENSKSYQSNKKKGWEVKSTYTQYEHSPKPLADGEEINF